MGFDKVKMKQIRGLILFVAALVLLLIYSQSVIEGLALFLSIIQPFLIGGAMAFVLNIPLKGIEKGLLKKWNGKVAGRIKRPVSLVLTIVTLVLVVTLVVGTVVPQIGKTAMELGVQIPRFFENLLAELEKLTVAYPQIWEQVQKLENMEINWNSVLDSIVNFLKNGMGSVLTSAFSITSSVIGGVANGFISLIFSIYILMSKEKLACQGERVLRAYCSEKWYGRVLKVLGLLGKNFSSFISGQCLEAVILGTMFVIAMTIFGFPYAVTVGVLIAFTALIPIVGAFVGCFVGAFLIMINDPIQAIWFVVLFLILQQVEGNLIYPRVVGNSVGLPSIWVLAAVSIGGSLMGVGGMLIFIPLVSTVYSLFRENVNQRNSGCKTGREEAAVTGREEPARAKSADEAEKSAGIKKSVEAEKNAGVKKPQERKRGQGQKSPAKPKSAERP